MSGDTTRPGKAVTRPFGPGDRVIHQVRGKGLVVSSFRQEKGERKWICWVTFFKGEQHAIEADALRPDPEYRVLG